MAGFGAGAGAGTRCRPRARLSQEALELVVHRVARRGVGATLDVAQRVVEVIGGGGQVGVVPRTVAQRHTPAVVERSPQIRRVAQAPRLDVEADEAGEGLGGRAADPAAPGSFAEASAGKLYAAQAAMDVALEAVQIFGGNGYMAEFEVEQLARDAKVLQIYAGTDEIQVSAVARALLAEQAGTA